jgi:IS30 family transposase
MDTVEASHNLGIKHLSEKEKGQILAYFDSGLSGREIATKLGRHQTTITNWYKKYTTTGNVPKAVQNLKNCHSESCLTSNYCVNVIHLQQFVK